MQNKQTCDVTTRYSWQAAEDKPPGISATPVERIRLRDGFDRIQVRFDLLLNKFR